MPKMKHPVIILIVCLVFMSTTFAGGNYDLNLSGSNSVVDISSAEAADLTFMREEEKLARDVYDTFFQTWDIPIFDNISNSEQTHFDAIGDLLDSYRLKDPSTPDQPRVFLNEELQRLYDQLILRGSESSLQALFVGALIEEVDINDLEEAIARSSNQDIVRVYSNLLRGSRNHLRVFVGAIETQGITYEAQVLSQEEVDSIVDSPMERGRAR